MIASMTAFARVGHDNFTWELRSINNRSIDVSFNLPKTLSAAEPLLREIVRSSIHRGRITATLHISDVATEQPQRVDTVRLTNLLAMIREVQRNVPDIAALDLMELMHWPGILVSAPGNCDDLVNLVTSKFAGAIQQLKLQRKREGTELEKVLRSKIAEIELIIHQVREDGQYQSDLVRARLQGRLAKLNATVDVDSARLEQEVAMYAQRSDFNEELDLLKLYVGEVCGCLKSDGPHGRRLDFLAQELAREANTLASKAIHHKCSLLAVDLKVLIDQVREQAQNIE